MWLEDLQNLSTQCPRQIHMYILMNMTNEFLLFSGVYFISNLLTSISKESFSLLILCLIILTFFLLFPFLIFSCPFSLRIFVSILQLFFLQPFPPTPGRYRINLNFIHLCITLVARFVLN